MPEIIVSNEKIITIMFLKKGSASVLACGEIRREQSLRFAIPFVMRPFC